MKMTVNQYIAVFSTPSSQSCASSKWRAADQPPNADDHIKLETQNSNLDGCSVDIKCETRSCNLKLSYFIQQSVNSRSYKLYCCL